jgi:D-alanyl-D-alanine dipeptidase
MTNLHLERRMFLGAAAALLLAPRQLWAEATAGIPGVTVPPIEAGPFRKSDLVELIKLEPRLKLDIKYATPNNFAGQQVYTQARAFLQRPAAKALLRAHRKARRLGYGFLIFDGYRPWDVTRLFREVTPPHLHSFVANPMKGSKHNRGCAVDMTLFDLKTGQEVQMPTPYDDFTDKADPDYTGGTAEQRQARDLLRRLMEAEGFTVDGGEWWHFDYKDWRKYAIGNLPFEKL